MTLTSELQTVFDAYLLPYTGRTYAQDQHWLDRYLAWCATEQLRLFDVTRRDIERM